MNSKKLKAPFPYFGGKSRVAKTVWDGLGDVDNFIEPFCGSAAVLLARPHSPRIETINDADCYVANFWRATGKDPEAVAEYADGPVNEADLHARHRWLVLSDEAKKFRKRIRRNPDYFEAKVAGWWCWGLCCWIGGGWCAEPKSEKLPRLMGQQPSLSSETGVHGRHRPQLADAYSRGRGVNGNDAAGTCEQRRTWLLNWFGHLRDRLCTVRVCCGDWLRVCDSESMTTRLGLTGIFFDPPYGHDANRAENLYATDCLDVAAKVRSYCLERGGNKKMRICLAGYAGEGHEELEVAGWSVVEWQAQGGYGNRSKKGKENAKKERLWFSPGCKKKIKIGFFE
jgi:site-specific DNA-adenine methylase